MPILIVEDDFAFRVLPLSTGCCRRWSGRRPCALPATAPNRLQPRHRLKCVKKLHPDFCKDGDDDAGKRTT